MADSVTLYVDNAQSRLKEDGMSTLASGVDWDPVTATGVFVDPVTRTATLLPGVLDTRNWQTSNAGIYQKWALSDLIGKSPATGWVENEVDPGAGKFYAYPADNTLGANGQSPVVAANTPIVLEFFAGAGTNSAGAIIEFGYGTTAYGAGAGDVGFRYFNDGRVEVWKSGVKVGEGSVSEKKEYATAILGTAAASVKSTYVTLLIIPGRDREIFVGSTTGGAFVHVFEDLLEGVAGQTITPNDSFWFSVPAGISVQGVRMAKLQYVASGSISGRPSAWRQDPTGETIHTHIYQALSQEGLTLVALSAITPATNPYSLPYPVQLKFDLTRGASGETPFLYGGRAYTDPTRADTATSAGHFPNGVNVTAHTRRLSLEIGDSIGGTKCGIVLTRPDAIEAAGAPYIRRLSSRAFKLVAAIDGQLFNGVLSAPKRSDIWSPVDPDSAELVEFEGRTTWELAERYIFSDPVPLDGLDLKTAYTLVANAAGLSAIVSASASSIPLGNAGVKHGSEGFNVMIEVGDKASEWLDRLAQTYCALWHHGVNAAGVLELIDPADMPSTTDITLYRTADEAITAYSGTLDTDTAARYVYRTHKVEYLPAEANDVYVMGMDYRTGRPIIVHSRDDDSANPAIGVLGRPANWLGEPVKYAWTDPSLSNEDLCAAALEQLFVRVTASRELHEFTCERIPYVTPGMLVILAGANEDGSDVTVRIKTLSGEFRQVGDAGYVSEPFTYVGEAGDLVCPLGVPGTRVATIRAAHDLKRFARYSEWVTKQQFIKALGRLALIIR